MARSTRCRAIRRYPSTENPGYFTYEVLGVQGNALRSLVAGETMTIQVVPR